MKIVINADLSINLAKNNIFEKYYKNKYMWNSHIEGLYNRKAYFYNFDSTTLSDMMNYPSVSFGCKVSMTELFTHINNIISHNNKFSVKFKDTKKITFSLNTLYSDFTINLYFAINIYFNYELPEFNDTLPMEYRNILDGLNLNLINKDLISRYSKINSFFDKGSLHHEQNKLTESDGEWDRKEGIFYNFLKTLEVREGITKFLDNYVSGEIEQEELNTELKKLIDELTQFVE